jgi:hypothetical protein
LRAAFRAGFLPVFFALFLVALRADFRAAGFRAAFFFAAFLAGFRAAFFPAGLAAFFRAAEAAGLAADWGAEDAGASGAGAGGVGGGGAGSFASGIGSIQPEPDQPNSILCIAAIQASSERGCGVDPPPVTRRERACRES